MDLGETISYEKRNNTLTIHTAQGIMELSFVQEDIMRLRFGRGTALEERETLVVETIPDLKKFELITSSPETLLLKTGSIRVNLLLNPLSMQVYTNEGQKIVSTPAANTTTLEAHTSTIRFMLTPDEKIYGLGQDPMANLNHRDKERRMWHEWGAHRRSGNGGIPFYMSSEGYGFLLNSSYPSRFAIGKAEVAEPGYEVNYAPAPWAWGQDSGETHPDRLAVLLDEDSMDLFLICRKTFDQIQKGYVELTGYAPMPPKWALGFIQCKNRYRNQEELLYIAREYRRKKIPCDVLVIDWLWFKEFGDLEWFKESWPNPRGMLKELNEMGFHVLQAQHPFIEKHSLKYDTFKAKAYLNKTPEGTRPTYDHSNPEARKAWWQEIKRFYEDGIRGYWTDMGELEVHPVGTESYLGSRERVHNIYSSLWNKGLYEGQRRDFKERVFNLPRAAYAGIQRYGSALWSGDIDASWEVLHDQVIIGQGVCLSGQQYWCTDIGGFITDERFTDELYIRWLQWGTFCPIFRTHGTRPDNEAWSFGKQAEKIISDFLELRYRLLPYIYSCARKVTEAGTPIMRAMCMDFADDSTAVAQYTQFMFGPAFLVAPIVEKGARSRKVYLPSGIWYDFWTGEKYSGKRWIEAAAPLHRLPLYVKGGSIIPLGPRIEWAAGEAPETLDIHAYAGGTGSFEMYEDDGLTYGYEKGEYIKTLITMDASCHVSVQKLEGEDALIPANRKYNIVVHRGEKDQTQACSSITVDVDHSLSANGHCTISALITNRRESEAAVKASLHLPTGWTLKSEEKPVIAKNVKDFTCMQWEVLPLANALPLVHHASIIFEVQQKEKTEHICREICWGSGYATRWKIVGNFDNPGEKGLDNIFEVEHNLHQPYYEEDGQKLQWNRNPDQEFNCFGYVALPHPPKSPNIAQEFVKGVSYAKCGIWSEKETQGRIEISADPSIKLWLNDELICQKDGIVLKQVLEQPVTLKEGWNSVLIKIAIACDKPASGREYGFNFRIVDQDKHLMNHLLYRA